MQNITPLILDSLVKNDTLRFRFLVKKYALFRMMSIKKNLYKKSGKQTKLIG